MRIAVATCRPLPEPDVDEPLLLEALEKAGIVAEMTAWDDPSVAWDTYDACVVRSTWNYLDAPGEFADWIREVSTKTLLLNPAEAMIPNIHKRYLLNLEKAGVKIVPTKVLGKGEEVERVDFFEGRAIVIKPAISAGSWLTRKFIPSQFSEGVTFLAQNLTDQDMLVQPYLESVERREEIAWNWIDGEVTHGVRKSPRFDEGYEDVSNAVYPTDEDRQRLAHIMDRAPQNLLYARIDLMEDQGDWLLSELELIEPSLFFKQNPDAISKFIEALRRRVAFGK
ncbi:MAG: hypothetical protein H7Y17_11840 [Chlorobia bacterium]|nr:hypothetical protein [Fimbriimonadaceae bacterium]